MLLRLRVIDDDDKMYILYGNPATNIAQLSADGTSEFNNQEVYKSNGETLEGSRIYKANGNYYIFTTRPANAEFVLEASSPFGSCTRQTLVESISGPISRAGFAHQGSMVDIKDGEYFYIAFMDSFPGGRIPVATPLAWTSDGWPPFQKVNNAWGQSYPMPVQTSKIVPKPTGQDTFTRTSLGLEWEWNHNSDTSKFTLLSSGGPRNEQPLRRPQQPHAPHP